MVTDLPSNTDVLAPKRNLGGPEFRPTHALYYGAEIAFGEGFRRSNNVGGDFALAS